MRMGKNILRQRITLLSLTFLFIAEASGQVFSLQQLEAQRKAALEEIASTQQLLNETSGLAANLFNRLKLISEQVLARKKVINLLNTEIALIDKDLAGMNNELAILETDLNNQRAKYIQSLQNMQTKQKSQYKWLFILSADNFTQSVRRMRYLHEYSEWRKQQARQIIAKQEIIKQKQAEMEATRAEKRALLNDREKESGQLQKEETAQKQEYQQLEKKRKSLQEDIKRRKKEAEALNRQIEQLIERDIARSSNDKSVARKADTAGGYAMTKEEKKLSDDFVANRGRLPFPLTGKYKIINTFGEHQHPLEKRVTLKCNGIEIQTTEGTDAQAVFNGEVSMINLTPSGSYNIIVRHGNYMSIYINLSSIYVKAGDKVATRQKLGKILTNPVTRVTMLHFEIRKEKEALNPELWLD